jgi:hypothetical protein
MGFPRWGRFTNDKLSPSGKFRTRNAILRIAVAGAQGYAPEAEYNNPVNG